MVMVSSGEQYLLVGSRSGISHEVDGMRKSDFRLYCKHFFAGRVYISWILRVFCKHDGSVDIIQRVSPFIIDTKGLSLYYSLLLIIGPFIIGIRAGGSRLPLGKWQQGFRSPRWNASLHWTRLRQSS
jgi:hypothetical protein